MSADAAVSLRLAYLAAAALVLVVSAVPALRSRFLDYGPRTHTIALSKEESEKVRIKGAPTNVIVALLDCAAKMRVPHSWFASFYAISVICSLYWAAELLNKGPAFRNVTAAIAMRSHSMTFRQVTIVWLMMMAQSSRRLYECMVISKPSQSQMWLGHWLLGVFFYLGLSVAVWIDGTTSIAHHKFSVKDLILDGPSVRTFIGLIIFMLASGLQHDCHAYLASLGQPKRGDDKTWKAEYKFPEHPAFNISLTPHYLAECCIYLSLAIVAAPRGQWLNWTLASAMVFVVANLGVTARGTKTWYEARFGTDKVRGKARMIPFLY